MTKVLVLGINGRIGHQAAESFLEAGWQVAGFGRSNREPIAGVTFIEGNAGNPAEIARAAADADVVVNALNLPYDKWHSGRAEAQLEAVLSGLKGSGKTLLFPGNIYNFGAKQHVLAPDTPQRPSRDKGEIRVRLEQRLKSAAEAGDVQVLVLRSGDFYGPGATGTYFDLAMLTKLKRGILQYPADPAVWHSWAYLPDLGRAYVKLAETRAGLGRFENFHFRGHFVTGSQMIAAVQAGLPRQMRVVRFPWWQLRLLSPFMPILRELLKMRYLWEEPHELRDARLDALLGEGAHTPFEQAVAATVNCYLKQNPVDRSAPKMEGAGMGNALLKS